jgi:soluble lytic murein transglycosylase
MRFLLFLLLLFPTLAPANEEKDFLAARDAFRAGNRAKLEQLAERLVRSPLEPYVAYYQLRLMLETTDPSSIQAYLARPADTPMIDRLRGEWLRKLGKGQQWQTFLAEFPRLQTPELELSCYALQARAQTQPTQALSDDVLREARSLWLVGREQPESCNALFEVALSRNLITEQDVWQRLRLALESGNVSLAKRLSARLPATLTIAPTLLDSAAANPERYLDHAELEPGNEAQRQVALFAIQRLAKQSPALAHARWERMAAHFPDSEHGYIHGWLGYEAAFRLDGRALEWYRAAGHAPLTDVQREWRVRASLRAHHWPEVLNSIALMPPSQQQEAPWRYWKGRALKEQGKLAEANKLFIDLSREINFYGQLAGEELGTVIENDHGHGKGGYRPSKAELEVVAALPGIRRALALYRMDMRVEASKEWAWTLRRLSDKQLLAAAEIARRNEMYDRAISAADRTVELHDFNLRYLAPYRDELRGHLHDNGLEEAWVYGLMRQESRFVTQAKSTVGAAGLMQIMPATAKWVAKKLGLKSYKQSLIHQLETNLKLGTYYMKTVLDWFDGSPVLASAAYNAGPGRARRWRAEIPLEGAIYAETIPFNETRDYVKKVMSNTVYYAAQFDQPHQPLKQRLGVIAPKTSGNQVPIADER